MSTTVFCEQCGATVEAASRFCTECGTEQSAAQVPEAPVAEPSMHKHVDEAPAVLNAAGPAGSPANDEAPPRTSQADGFTDTGARQTGNPLLAGSPASTALPMIADLPLELWLVIAAFAIPGGWIAFEVLKALPDAFKALGSQFFGFRIGLAFVLILALVGLFGAAMLAIAWKLYRRDRVGRGLAYASGATIIVSVLFSSSRTSGETWAMILSAVGIAILAFAPRVRTIFDQAASPDGAPTSVIVSRTLIAIFSAIAIVTTVIYLLLATVKGAYILAAIVAGGAAFAASRWSSHLERRDRTARLYLSIGGGCVALLLIIAGRSTVGLLFPLGLIVSAVGCLWIPNDARAFFGDQPLSLFDA